jgi:hypothetical protein
MLIPDPDFFPFRARQQKKEQGKNKLVVLLLPFLVENGLII